MSDKTDPQEVKEILEVISTEIPKLLEAINQAMYNKENAESFGKSVAAFYKQMKDAGMDDKQAYELTERFMKNFSMSGMIGQVFHSSKHWEKDDEIEKHINEKIKKKIDKAMDDDEE